MPKVVIAAGGTAGHVVPALAVADVLRDRGAEVEFIGGERAEAELVPAAGYTLHGLRVSGIDRSNVLRGRCCRPCAPAAGHGACCAAPAPTPFSAAEATWPAPSGSPPAPLGCRSC
jgi:methylmalonyl-CoA mutase cobalamin-binding subunit